MVLTSPKHSGSVSSRKAREGKHKVSKYSREALLSLANEISVSLEFHQTAYSRVRVVGSTKWLRCGQMYQHLYTRRKTILGMKLKT